MTMNVTRKEAIKTLRELWRETNDSWYEEVFNMAIDALSEPSGDLISRVDAIKAVWNAYADAINIGDSGEEIAGDIDIILSALPSAEDEWTPVSEGLPKAEYGESDCVMATCCWKSDTTTRWVEKLYFNGGNWCYPTGECFTHKVIAWKPLPEPYREDGEA